MWRTRGRAVNNLLITSHLEHFFAPLLNHLAELWKHRRASKIGVTRGGPELAPVASKLLLPNYIENEEERGPT